MRRKNGRHVHCPQDSANRQWLAASKALSQIGLTSKGAKKVKDIISGGVPLAQRTKLLTLLNTVTDIYVESSRALSRKSVVGEELFELARAKGVNIVCSDFPTLFNPNATPIESFMRKVVLAMNELERDIVVSRLQSGLESKKKTSTKKTQCGKVKVNGRRSWLERLQPGASTINKIKRMAGERAKGKFGWRTLAKQISTLLKIKKNLSPETTRRMVHEIDAK